MTKRVINLQGKINRFMGQFGESPFAVMFTLEGDSRVHRMRVGSSDTIQLTRTGDQVVIVAEESGFLKVVQVKQWRNLNLEQELGGPDKVAQFAQY